MKPITEPSRPSSLLVKDFLLLVVLVTICLLLSPNVKAQSSQASDALALENLSLRIDARISKMKLIARSLANDAHIHNWVNNGFKPSEEVLLLEKLQFYVDKHQLTSASFADKNSNKYWNHEGFLRVLDENIDTWYFAYLEDGAEDLISVYHDKNKKRVDIYVNFQQTDGNGLSGIATSFDGVLAILQASDFAKYGTLYLIDNNGRIQLSTDTDAEQNQSTRIQDYYASDTIESLLNQSAKGGSSAVYHERLSASYIPSMGWHIVHAPAPKL